MLRAFCMPKSFLKKCILALNSVEKLRFSEYNICCIRMKRRY